MKTDKLRHSWLVLALTTACSLATAACSSSQGDGSSGGPTAIDEKEPVDVAALRTSFLTAVEKLATGYAAGVEASCATGANEVMFDTMRAIMQKIMSEMLDMQTVLGMMASGNMNWGDWGSWGGQPGAVDQEAMKEAMRVMLGDEPFDPSCDENKQPRTPMDTEALVSWIEENLLADALIVAHDSEAVTFRLDGDTVCRLFVQGKNGAPPDEDQIELCIKRAAQADVRMTLRPAAGESIAGEITTGGGAARVLSLNVEPRGEIVSEMDLSEIQTMLTEFGEEEPTEMAQSEMRGRLATRLSVQPDSTTAFEGSIVEPLWMASSVRGEDEQVTGHMTMSLAASSPFAKGSISPTDGCLRAGINVRDVYIEWTPEGDGADTAPLQMTLPAASAEIIGCGDPRDVRIVGVSAGSATAYTRSGEHTMCALDINGSQGTVADILFDKRDGIHYATAKPKLDFSLHCQPVPGAASALDPLLRDYAFTLTDGEWMSLEPKSTFLTWLLDLLLGL